MRRGDFLSHVAWTGAGIAYTISAQGLAVGRALGEPGAAARFVQISDSHIGFHQAANPDVTATLQSCVSAINALPEQPDFVVHTGDITHLSTPQQFDDAHAILHTLRAPLIALPGEHDVLGNDFKPYLSNFKIKGATDGGWASWDAGGVHYVVLLNVFSFETMGLIGNDQLDWLRRDLAARPPSTPIVVFTHVPLYALFPSWGWTTQDGANALALLRPFDHVTVLYGHIHQIVTHVDGNLHFASAMSTAYPQPAPGTAPKPGPLALPHDGLLHAIGYRNVQVDRGDADFQDHSLGAGA
jgi:3',5'-cyclic-AMP phosphodiesterase